MVHTRPLPILTLASAALFLIVVWATAQAQQPVGADPERAFAFGDTDLDGQLTLAEFRDLLGNAPRFKKAAGKNASALFDPMFGRLDANRDGFLSIPEYRQIAQFGAGRVGAPARASGPTAKTADKSRAAANPSALPLDFAARPITAEQTRFFETRIRPVLATKCAECHASTAAKIKGGLLVDSREGLLRGGDTGPAVVGGNLDASLLIAAIRFADDSLQMPPKAKLPDSVIADFEAWVKMGAPDPRTDSGAQSATRTGIDLAKGRQFWAFQPPRSMTPPQVKESAWPRSSIDQFLLAALEAKGLRPGGDADRYTLIRRASFDLVGLPPAPEEVEEFVADRSPDAFAKVVDRLLASPRFGERWGRHWLDVARYGESSGKVNMLYPQAWRYRDWVIAAFNADQPYDQFVTQQIAGDLLPGRNDQDRAESLIATGFLAIGSKAHNTQERKQFAVDLADEQIEATSHAFLGLTVACARCHDHKFDPISQSDYYALSSIFQSTQTRYGTLPGIIQNANPSPLIILPDDAKVPSTQPPLPPGRRTQLESQLAELVKARDALTPEENFTVQGFQTRGRAAMLRFRLASYRPDGTPRNYAMGAAERFEPIDSPVYIRGELEHPGDPAHRGLIQVLCATTPPQITHGSGRRELAAWLAAPANPLTARVMVNRVWLHLFGRGLVATPDDFGAAGEPPSHPELLDTLAVSFMDQGWSTKSLIRQVVLSRAYQLSSTHDPRNFEADPDNTLLWRMSPRRLEAEAVRDSILAASGELDLRPPVGSAVALAGEGRAAPRQRFDRDAANRHRAAYLPVVRDQLPESLALFDFADPSIVTGERSTTSGPAQALYLLNSPFVIDQAATAARRLLRLDGDDTHRIQQAYLTFLGRPPTAAERDRAREFLASFAAGTGEEASSKDRVADAWAAFCQILFAGAEFRYLN